jgi:hypothetical protein
MADNEEKIEDQEVEQHQENGGEQNAQETEVLGDFANWDKPKGETDSPADDKANQDQEVEDEDDDEEFTIFPKEKEEVKKKAETDKGEPSKRDYSKFKEVLEDDEDISDDDTLLQKVKGIVGKAKAQEIINTANEKFATDEQVIAWRSWLEAEDDDLAENIFVHGKGYTEEDAKAKVLQLKDTDPMEYRAIVNQAKNQLRTLIGDKAQAIKDEVEQAAQTLKAINPKEVDTKVLKSASESTSKMSEFAGMNIGVTDKNREAFMKPVKSLIESGEIIKKIKSDPDLLAEVAYYVQYKEQIKTAVKARLASKKKFVDGLDKAPHSSGKATPRARAKDADTKGFNEVGW